MQAAMEQLCYAHCVSGNHLYLVNRCKKTTGFGAFTNKGATKPGLRHAISTKARKIDPFSCDQRKLLDRFNRNFHPRSQCALMGARSGADY
jgi:hypothetical protein